MLLSFSSSKAKLTSVFFVSLSFRLLPSFYWSFVSRSASYHDEKKKAANFYGLSFFFPFLKQPLSLPQSGNVSPILLQLFLFVLCKRRVSFASRFFLLFQLPRMRFAGFFAKYNSWIDLFVKCRFMHCCSHSKQYSKTKVSLANPYFWHFFCCTPSSLRLSGESLAARISNFFLLKLDPRNVFSHSTPTRFLWRACLDRKETERIAASKITRI